MGDSGVQAEQLLDSPMDNTVAPRTVSIEDIIKKETEEPQEEIAPLFVTVHDIKREAPDLAGEPGCSKWDDDSALGPSWKVVKGEPDCGPSSSDEIKSEPPDPDVKQEQSRGEDSNSSFPGADQYLEDGTAIKPEEQNDVEMKSEEQLKEEELILDGEGRTKQGTSKIEYEESEGEKETLFKCERCDFSSKYRRSLRQHSVIHKDDNEIKWFQCPHCSFKTRWKGSLTKHLKTHKRAIWFYCQSCHYKSIDRNHFQDHPCKDKILFTIAI